MNYKKTMCMPKGTTGLKREWRRFLIDLKCFSSPINKSTQVVNFFKIVPPTHTQILYDITQIKFYCTLFEHFHLSSSKHLKWKNLVLDLLCFLVYCCCFKAILSLTEKLLTLYVRDCNTSKTLHNQVRTEKFSAIINFNL